MNIPFSHRNTRWALVDFVEMAIPKRAAWWARKMTQRRKIIGIEKNGINSPEEEAREPKPAKVPDEC